MQVGDTVTFKDTAVNWTEYKIVAFTLDHLGLYLRDGCGFRQARVDEVEVVEIGPEKHGHIAFAPAFRS